MQMRKMTVVSLLVALGFAASMAYAGFTEDLLKVQNGSLTLTQAVCNAFDAKESQSSVAQAAVNANMNQIALAAGFLACGASQAQTRAALIAAGVDAEAADTAIVLALSEISPPAGGGPGVGTGGILRGGAGGGGASDS